MGVHTRNAAAGIYWENLAAFLHAEKHDDHTGSKRNGLYSFKGDHNDAAGTVFKVTKSGKETALHFFNGFGDGAEPGASLINVNGWLYGTTPAFANHTCADFGCGTVFKVKL